MRDERRLEMCLVRSGNAYVYRYVQPALDGTPLLSSQLIAAIEPLMAIRPLYVVGVIIQVTRNVRSGSSAVGVPVVARQD